jgi:hypothetical protein
VPRFTFYVAEDDRYRPQFTIASGRHHPSLRKSDGSYVRGGDEHCIPEAMAAYCRKLISAALLDVESDVAQHYVGAGAKVLPIPMAPRAPAPAASEHSAPAGPKREARAPVPGWHGIDVLSIEVDHRLVAELSPDGSAAKIGVAPGTPAARAGLRTGDYVLSAGRYGNAASLADFDALCLPAGTEILVRFHRPGRHKAGQVETALLKLRRRRGVSRPRWWQLTPRVEPGPAVGRDDRSVFEAQMARHPHIKPLGFRMLIRLLRHYDGKHGAFPSYRRLASDVGSGRKATAIEHVKALEWLGVVEIIVGGGRRGLGGSTNRFVLHWPATDENFRPLGKK